MNKCSSVAVVVVAVAVAVVVVVVVVVAAVAVSELSRLFPAPGDSERRAFTFYGSVKCRSLPSSLSLPFSHLSLRLSLSLSPPASYMQL